MAKNEEPVELTVTICSWTGRAVEVHDGKRSVWIPRSQLEDDIDDDEVEEGQEMTITIPEWLALDKGLI